MRPRPLVWLSLLSSLAVAQAPSPWASLAVPGGVVQTALTSLGKIATYHSGGVLHVWSAMTRRWYSMPATGSATTRVYNDLLFVQDGATWTAFSAWLGRFAPLPVSPTAVVVNLPTSTNDSAVLVVDGGQLHAFSAFVGVWTARPFPATAMASVQRHVGVLADGAGTLGGYDAYTGQWLDIPTTAAITFLSTDGTAGFATGNGVAFAFSASERTWQAASLPAGTTFVRGDDFGLWYTAQRTFGYSAIRGAFAQAQHGATSTLTGMDTYALLETPLGIVGFSAFTASFSDVIVPSGVAVTSGAAVALLASGSDVHAYSAVLNSSSRRSNGASIGAASIVGWTRDATHGRPSFFSALTGAWHEAPANALAVDPTLTTTCAAAPTTSGCVAFSGRTGRFVPLADPTVQPSGNVSSAPLVALGATQLHAFDARLDVWRSIARTAAGPVQAQIWRTALLVIDGSTAFAFGVQAGTWSTQVLPGPVLGIRVNSESVRLHTANDVFVHSSMSESAWFGQYPEFRRVQPVATPLRACVLVPSGGLGVAGLAPLAATTLAIPGLGDLWLQPAALTLMAVPASPVGEGVLIAWPGIPSAALLGTELGMQAALWPAAGTPWLTELATVRLL